MEKYIFPGGYTPSFSETLTSIEHSGLWTLDIEIWRKHYGWTLREWRKRCVLNKDQIIQMYDERFYRMLEFYLPACEGVFMHGNSHVFQMKLARTRDVVPLIRDYISEVSAQIALKEPEFVSHLVGATNQACAEITI